ncbi:Spy/CpxP family protein refolding chaperone [Paraburkholderia acidisoli]|uniref:LTXXQ motif family protein n=1 Tax=Paraburkholderia acidisoli TaxID=2571748 RepID=A0A7Z2JJW0_9BURK|nr:Spy/CpxP family protein refolding chaperone [Paraburkholderia acidisoli]QGZ66683.1 hypothetical protein FAZ98_33580 [Paraburkholderia acidisoli]
MNTLITIRTPHTINTINTIRNLRRSAVMSLVSAVAAASLVLASAPANAQALPANPIGDTSNANGASEARPQAIDIRQLHDTLNLTATQEVQWQAALDAMRNSHAAAKMNADQMQVSMQRLIDQPVLDLNAIHAAHMKAAQADALLPEQSSKTWLVFYSGLNNDQKKVFSDALRPQLAFVAHHAARPFDPRTGL